jgi:uncharacterized RDD family membrane protein YckC
VLASGVHVCTFCSSSALLTTRQEAVAVEDLACADEKPRAEWRGELDQRLQAYRAKRKKTVKNDGQSHLPFEDHPGQLGSAGVAVQTEEAADQRPSVSQRAEDFAFTIAIGRPPGRQEADEPRVVIDVSVPPQQETVPPCAGARPTNSVECRLFPAASLHERRITALIDVACLAFAYGGFLALFGSLGGHFTVSKLSGTICFFTLAFVYLQYFGLFTIFGGTTPGMLIRGLQVVSFSGDVPTPRQYLLRATGYLLSAGTMFLGFLWAMWDEDELTWHDRLSRTYLAIPDPLLDTEGASTSPVRKAEGLQPAQ